MGEGSITIEEFDDPALLDACDFYASLDNVSYAHIGTALEPCTRRLPFKIPYVTEMSGTKIYLRFKPFRTNHFAHTHEFVLRPGIQTLGIAHSSRAV